MKQTASGQPEARFSGRSLDDVRSALVDGCMRVGAQVQSAQNEVLCTSTMQGGEAALAQLAIGNGYSTTPERKVRFNLVQRGSDVDVIAYQWVETQMAFGQVRKAPMTHPKHLNDMQAFMLGLGGY